MNVSINITIPEETLRLLDDAAPKGGRSALIDRAVRQYFVNLKRREMERQLKEAFIANAQDDLRIVHDFEGVGGEFCGDLEA